MVQMNLCLKNYNCSAKTVGRAGLVQPQDGPVRRDTAKQYKNRNNV